MTWYVHRRGGAIASAHQQPQRGYAEEALPDDDAEMVTFLEAPKIAAKTREDARAVAITVLETRGSGAPTREEIEALKAAVRALVIST